MGVDKTERTVLVTRGPFQLTRHPIYLFQVLMLAGTALLLPTLLSGVTLLIHFVCVQIKATGEESYLLLAHGEEYRYYLGRTGRLIPRWRR